MTASNQHKEREQVLRHLRATPCDGCNGAADYIRSLEEQVQALEAACDHHKMFWQKGEERERELKEQYQAEQQHARDMEKAANAMSADVTRFGTALQEIIDLDPRLTEDGYERGEDSRYEDEVAEIAEAAMRGVSSPAMRPSDG